MRLYEGSDGVMYEEEPPSSRRFREFTSIEQLALYMGCSVSQLILRQDGSWTHEGIEGVLALGHQRDLGRASGVEQGIRPPLER